MLTFKHTTTSYLIFNVLLNDITNLKPVQSNYILNKGCRKDNVRMF